MGWEESSRGFRRGYQKEGMTAQRAWYWDLHEMRAAARMDDPLLDETLDDFYSSASKVANSTPINLGGHSDTAPVDSEHDNAALKSTAADKPRAPKRRKTQPSAATTASKPKKSRRAKTAAQMDCQDISKGLSRTKPTASQDRALIAKARLSFAGIPSKQNQDQQRVGDIPVESDVKPAPSKLADKYQAAYPNFMSNVVNHAAPSTPPTPANSDKVKADICQNDQSRDKDPATERQACPDTYVERSIQENPKFDGSIMIRDFGAPPFTQTSPPTLPEPSSPGTMVANKFDPLNSVSNDLLGVGDIKYGDHDGRDDFPIDDKFFVEMMQPTEVGAEEELLCLEWPPQEPSDATLYTDEQPDKDPSHWSEDIPHSDREVLYDEGPTLVIDDVVDVLSSPTWSSQASCILTHVTGNAEPNRARRSEGSENCFDDHDLDDGLIDLTVDDPKSLQSTSPVIPAKPPLSPKLQWLPPKTYTPARSSQVPVSLTDDPHLVPVNFSRNALPFIRPRFPKAIRDRSPILGLSNRTVLRTCFRIGEALNAAAVASRTNVDAIVELYARVMTSSREASGGYKQFFQFGDLFTDKPPYLNGTYTFWKGVNLWDNDSKYFVGEQGRGKMARVLGRIKRKEPVQGQGHAVEMAVLSIWEVDWEDVNTAKGIVCAG